MAKREADWQWDLEPDHWIELFLTDTGLSYVGWDYTCQSGGGYTAGFQSREQFLERGPIAEMPDAIAAQVRARLELASRGHAVTIELAGPTPDELHLQLDDQPMLLTRTTRLFSGSLSAGPHALSGVLLYPGADARGRRNAKRFELRFEVDGPRALSVERSTLAPRWET